MEVPELGKAQSNQPSTQATDDTASDSARETDGAAFATLMRKFLQPSQPEVLNEEELFAAMIRERLVTLHGEELATKYDQLLASNKESTRYANGTLHVEEAARLTLRGLVDSGDISKEDADSLHTQAFYAAQLDTDDTTLFDSIAGEGDPTRATLGIDVALEKARARLDNILSGGESPKALPVDTTESNTKYGSGAVNPITSLIPGIVPDIGEILEPEGTFFDGAEGFLFKPVSDSDGKLVVLLPAQISQQAERLVLRNAEGDLIEEGRDSGIANGDRRHFRFDHTGRDYPEGVIVEAVLSDGTTRSYRIPDPTQRYD